MWSPAFLSKLQQGTIRPRFVIETIRPPMTIAQGGWYVSSDPLLGGTCGLERLHPIRGTSVNPSDWSVSPGTFSFTVVGDTSTFRKNIWRGQMVQVLVGWPGQSRSQFETVAIGQVWGARGTLARLTVECRDLLAALGSRMTKTASQQPLFYDAFSTTTVDGGDTSAGATTVTVADTTGFSKQDNNGGSGTLNGCIMITPSSGDPFFKTYTGKTGTTFTGCSAAGQLGSTAVAFNTGDTVTEIPYVDDHPIDFFRRVLVSDGSFSSATGSYNWLPASWGLNLDDWMLDNQDMDAWKNRSTPATGSGEWEFHSLAAQADPLSWLCDRLRHGGFFPVVHQGRISCRAAQYLTSITQTAGLVNGVYSGSDLTVSDEYVDADGWPEWEAWDAGYQYEAESLKVKTATGSSTTTETVVSVPAQAQLLVDLSDRVFSNESNQRTLIGQRLRQWSLRLPEHLSVPFVGLRMARLSAGDAVKLNTTRAAGRLDTTVEGYADRWGMVIGTDVDWMAGRGTITLAVPPDKADDFG